MYVLEQKVKSIGEVTSGGSHEWVKSFKKDSKGIKGYNSFDYICGGGGGLEPRIYYEKGRGYAAFFFFKVLVIFFKVYRVIIHILYMRGSVRGFLFRKVWDE